MSLWQFVSQHIGYEVEVGGAVYFWYYQRIQVWGFEDRGEV